MFKITLFVVFIISGCGHSKSEDLSKSQMMMSGNAVPDFFTSKLDAKSASKMKNESTTENCRGHIEKIVCLVEPHDTDSIPNEDNRPCLDGSERYALPFLKLYDNYPTALQKMFCSLDKLYIEQDFIGTAYAGTILDDEGNIVGAKMGIRQTALDNQIDLSTWASWKEQLNFGGDKDIFIVNEELPRHMASRPTADTDDDVNDFLYFVVAHEFGHIFDFTNEINKIDEACEGDECPFESESWGNFSWESYSSANSDNEFFDRKSLCFYWCETNPVARERIPQLYRDLHRSNFISTYATTQAWDDFADSLGYFVLKHFLKSEYKVDTGQDARYDIMKKFNSEKFRLKREYIQKFLASPIIYP